MEEKNDNKIFSKYNKYKFAKIGILIILIGCLTALLLAVIDGERLIKLVILCFWAIFILELIITGRFIKKYRWLSEEAKEESPLL